MKLYSKKFVRRAMKKQTKAVQETRDSILWDVQRENKTCRVKIQGSDEYIIAHFPRNWKSIPYWLKSGNAVRILHRGGNRGYVEVIGEGRAIPTAVSGGSMPDEQTAIDGVVSGVNMIAMNTALGVYITPGTYRIDGDLYALNIANQYKLFDSETYVLYDSESYALFIPDSIGDGENIAMYLDPAPSVGSFRYDAFCIGVDGVVDYVKGAESTTPVEPILPTDHILIGSYILVVGGTTVIEEKDIGKVWTEPYASNLDIDIEDSGMSYDMPWEDDKTTSTATVALQLKDQYGNNYSGEFSGTLTKNTGGGEFSSFSTFTGSKNVTWTRDQTVFDTDIVVFTISGSVGMSPLTAIGIIKPMAQVV